jgi:hypothetical protein
MRAATLVVCAVLPLVSHVVAPWQEPTVQAEALLARARTALGGDARLSAVRTFVMSGVVTVGGGPTRDYGTFKVHGRLPDAFVRYRSVTTLRAGSGASVDTGSTNPYGIGGVSAHGRSYGTTLGFENRRLVYEPHDLFTTRQLVPASQSEIEGLFLQAQREFIRTTVVLFATSFAGAPVQFRDAVGDADAVVVSGAGSEFKLSFDPLSHLPVRLDKYVYADHREVNGVRVPFRILQMAGRTLWETWDVKEFKFDEPIPPSVFRR